MSEFSCSFCGKPRREVRKLISGPKGVTICNECTELCWDIASEDDEEKRGLTPREKQLRKVLQLMLDQVDYTRDACRMSEQVGAVLSQTVIKLARAALAGKEDKSDD